jgi:uncharacterized membrane protein YcaP (DUF421 family)
VSGEAEDPPMPDWYEMWVPSRPILDIVLRGTIVYLALLLFLRFVLHRQTGAVSITDMLLIVLIADASQNAMGEYRSVPEGLILVATLIFWNYALDWLSYRFPWLELLTHPPPLQLVRNGRLLRRNMKQELITEEDLLSELRKQGIEDVQEVKKAYMEGDGHISVIRQEPQKDQQKPRTGNPATNPSG